MLEYIPDYNDLYDAYEARRQRELDRFPKCDCCGEPITDDFLYDFDGDLWHESCLNDNNRKPVDDYIE